MRENDKKAEKHRKPYDFLVFLRFPAKNPLVHLKKHIYLSGFMGVGKSRVGRTLAQQMGCPYWDTDRVIETEEGSTIADIFLNKGEAYFRHLETKILRDLQNKNPGVVSLGGGAALRFQNREILKHGHWFFLHRPLSVIQKQLKFSHRRPLINPQNWKQLYQKREPVYFLANHILYCENFSYEVVCAKILKTVSFNQK